MKSWWSRNEIVFRSTHCIRLLACRLPLPDPVHEVLLSFPLRQHPRSNKNPIFLFLSASTLFTRPLTSNNQNTKSSVNLSIPQLVNNRPLVQHLHLHPLHLPCFKLSRLLPCWLSKWSPVRLNKRKNRILPSFL